MGLDLRCLDFLKDLVRSPGCEAKVLCIVDRFHLFFNLFVANYGFYSSVRIMHEKLVYGLLRNLHRLLGLTLLGLALLRLCCLQLCWLHLRGLRTSEIHKVLHHLIRRGVGCVLELRLLLGACLRLHRCCLQVITIRIGREIWQLLGSWSMLLIRSWRSSFLFFY